MSDDSIRPLLERFNALVNSFEAAVKRGDMTEELARLEADLHSALIELRTWIAEHHQREKK